jgi:autotransporter-associated beta strand protein
MKNFLPLALGLLSTALASSAWAQPKTYTNGENNRANLNVASGAAFAGVEANIRVDALSGSGTITSGYNGAGYTAFTFGVNNRSGTFSGVLADTNGANFVKAGSGTQTLSGASTYTGTISVVTSAVPDPSTCAAILGLGALGFAAWRKRCRAHLAG